MSSFIFVGFSTDQSRLNGAAVAFAVVADGAAAVVVAAVVTVAAVAASIFFFSSVLFRDQMQ